MRKAIRAKDVSFDNVTLRSFVFNMLPWRFPHLGSDFWENKLTTRKANVSELQIAERLVELVPLERPHHGRVAQSAWVATSLPKEIADQIIDRTDGVPLSIEELTKTVVESGIVTEAGDHYAVAGR